jgi:hypothetical protein
MVLRQVNGITQDLTINRDVESTFKQADIRPLPPTHKPVYSDERGHAETNEKRPLASPAGSFSVPPCP